jgi:hypothetical protein
MILGAAALVCGCNAGPDAARAQHEAQSEARAGAERQAGDAAAVTAADADMVSAVSSVPSNTPVSLKFRLIEPPRVGQALRVELALLQAPGLEIESLLLSLQPGEGLQLESDQNFEFHAPAAGATHRVVVTLRAQQPGLLNLDATALVNSRDGSLARSFSIPLIATAAPKP